MKKSRKYLAVFGGLFVLLLLLPLLMHYRAKVRLADYKTKLLASGEKLAISDLTPSPVPQGEKNAMALSRAAKDLTSPVDFYPNGMRTIKPGRARVAWRRTELNQEVDPAGIFTNVWPMLRQARTKNEEALSEIRGIFAAGNIQFPLAYQQADFVSGLVDHFIIGKRLVLYAGAEVILDLHDGRQNEAMDNLLLSINISKLSADEPLMISQLVRYAEVAVGVSSCWEALQFKGWTDEQLSHWQTQWEGLDFLSAAANSLAMERARAPMEFDLARKGKDQLDGLISHPYGAQNHIVDDILLNPPQGFNELMTASASYPRYWLWRGIWSYDDERQQMHLYQDMIDTIRAAQKRQAVLGRLTDFKPSYIGSQSQITDNERPFVERFVTQALRVQTEAQIVAAAIALERHFLSHHQYPAHLEDLAPMILKGAPIDYMDGKDLRYRLRPDGSYLLYSVGMDGVDNGGDPTPPADKGPGFMNGCDWVWPGVASEQEVGAYEAAEAQKAAQKQTKRGKPGNK